MPQKVTVSFQDASHLHTAESILANACPDRISALVCGGDSIGVIIDSADDKEVESIKAQVAGVNAIINEHSETFTVFVAEPVLH